MRSKRNLICGIGINDANYQVSKKLNGKSVVCKFYRTWTAMINRCYSPDFVKKHPTYINCEICDDWKYFSKFKAWMERQDWQGKQLDKDLLVKGNKIYSPDTCLFVDSQVNNFIIENDVNRGRFMIGVSFHKITKKLAATCRSNTERKNIHLGLFDDELSAHLAWKAKKHELACQLADMQTDKRVAEALRKRYE